MASITSANAVLVIAVPSLLPSTQLQGFAADDIFSVDPLQRKEVMMGVDGHLAAGRVFMPYKMGISLMADSPSMAFFEAWDAAEQSIADVYFANMTVNLPALNKKWACTRGALEIYPALPDAGRTLKPRKFAITWESVTPSPVS